MIDAKELAAAIRRDLTGPAKDRTQVGGAHGRLPAGASFGSAIQDRKLQDSHPTFSSRRRTRASSTNRAKPDTGGHNPVYGD